MQPATLIEVAEALGVSLERAYQIEQKALCKLRTLLRRQGLVLDDFVDVICRDRHDQRPKQWE